MRNLEIFFPAVALALLVGCGGTGGTVPGPDGGSVHPPAHVGCLDDSLWQMDFVDAASVFEESRARAYLDSRGHLRIVRYSSSTGALSLFERTGDGNFQREDMASDLFAEPHSVDSAVVRDSGEVVALVGHGEAVAFESVVTLGSDGWVVGESQPGDVDVRATCRQGTNAPNRVAEYFNPVDPSSPARLSEMFRFGAEGLGSLGHLPEHHAGCTTLMDGPLISVGLPPDFLGTAGYSLQGFDDVTGSWIEVGRYGTIEGKFSSSMDAVYDGVGGPHVLTPHSAPSREAIGDEGYDAVLYDVPTDGSAQTNSIDRLYYTRPNYPEQPTYARIGQLGAATDAGGLTHIVYERAGFDDGCQGCASPPEIEGGYGLRYAVRTDAGWVRKDLLWKAEQPEVTSGFITVQDLIAWNGEIHILVSLNQSLGVDPSFVFQSGEVETVWAPGLYDIHSTGCAFR